jgi:hypothetical protein
VLVEVAVAVGVPPVAVAVGVPPVAVEVGDGVMLAVGVPDAVPVAVTVGVWLEVEVDVAVDVAAVLVGVMLGLGVPVAVAVGVLLGDGVPVAVGVFDEVGVAVEVTPVPDNANLMFPPLLLTVRPLLRKILPAEVGWNTIIMSQRLAPGRDPSQVSLTSLKGGLTVMLLILIVFFLFVLMSATDNGALVVPTMTDPKSAPRMILELLARNCLVELLARNCKSPSDCANAGRASAPSMNNSTKVKAAIDRVNDLVPIIKNPP